MLTGSYIEHLPYTNSYIEHLPYTNSYIEHLPYTKSGINLWQTSIFSNKILSTSLSARSGLFHDHCPLDLVYFTACQIWSIS